MSAPDDPVLLCQRAFDHWNAGRGEAAEALFNQVLDADPDHAMALEGLAVIAVFRGESDKARALIGRVLAKGPASLETRLNFADILYRAGAYDEARALVGGLIAEHPDIPPAYYLQGQILWALGLIDEAFASYRKARLELAPELAGYFEYLCHDRLADCDWRGYQAQADFIRERLRTGQQSWQSMTPILMLDSPEDLARSARIIARQYPPAPPLWTGERYRHDRIRVGYLTADLCDHPVGNLIAGLLEHHDRTAFELTAFSFGPRLDDHVRRRLRPAFDEFLDLDTANDLSIARQIRNREIDILVNLSGYTRDAKPAILTHRPAPVQVSYLGYPASMGSPMADYLIADRHIVPERDVDLYAEKLVWMPDAYQPTDDLAPIGETPTRAEAGLPETGFVFMAYNHPNKIGPVIFERWMNILRRTPGSVLWLPKGGPAMIDNLRREAQGRGIDPDRLIFAPRIPERPGHIARHRLAGLFLDTLPFGAHSTASDALWAGLPVLTCRGKTLAGRVCAGLLTVAGLPELITETLDDYEDLAVALAVDPARLAQIRTHVGGEVRKSPLFDTARYTRHFEQALRTMVEISRSGGPPRSFAVEAET